MNPSLHADITKRLLDDYGFQKRKDWLRAGRCPQCEKKELYARAESPWVLRCGRTNNCGWEGHVKDLYSDLFESWSDRFPRTQTSPTAAADAYLQFARGFDLAHLRGCYTQEAYIDRALDASTATVRFALPGGGWWERLIDKPRRFGKKKANFAFGKSYAGYWWVPPGLDLAKVNEVWIVEGIFDAIALWLHGIAAVAAMSSNNYPEHALADLARARPGNKPTLVWALDGDKSGRDFTRKWVDRARSAAWNNAAAQIPQTGVGGKIDWNDLHQRDRLSESQLKGYRHQGALLIARKPSEKGLLIYNEAGRAKFPFEFGDRLWWFELDMTKYTKVRQQLLDSDKGLTEDDVKEQALAECNAIVEISTAYPQALYWQRDESTDESWYYFRISRPGDRPDIKATFTGAQIMAAADFGKRLANVAPGGLFTGSTGQLMALMKAQMGHLKVVQALDFVGYSREHGVYVFGDIAVKDGHLYEINAEDYFEISRLNIKTLLRSLKLDINPRAADYTEAWFADLWTGFGAQGVVALAFWLGSLFAEQIRGLDKSFPFLEIIGEAGAGKTTLIEFLWKLLGREHEGTDPTKSTLAGRTRTYAQIANLPLVLIEADRTNGSDKAHSKQFDWDELKPLYNGTIGRSRGIKSAGNETYEPPFRGAVVISQNAVVDGSDAMLQRIVHLAFTTAHHSPEGAAATKHLNAMDPDSVSGWVLTAVRREKTVMDTFAEFRGGYEKMLQANPKLKSQRICKNHAQLMALVDCLSCVTPITSAQKTHVLNVLTEMAVARQQAINADHPLVQEFWETVDYLEATSGLDLLNHSRDNDTIAINLPHFTEVATRHGLTKIPSHAELKRLLPDCRMHKFIGRKAVNSGIFTDPLDNTGRTVKCWVFERARSA